MKILAIGDFHGKFPEKLKKKLMKEEFDLIISLGDYEDSSIFREIEFKHWKELKCGEEFEDILGKRKYKEILKKTIRSSDFVFKSLKSFNKPIISIYGNADYLDEDLEEYRLKGLDSKCKKNNIKLLETRKIKIKGHVFAGFSGYRAAVPKGLIKEVDKEQKEDMKLFNKIWDGRLKRLFSKIKKPREMIFIAHDVPYGYFDIVQYKKSPMYKKHVGDEYLTKYIKKYQPLIALSGHMHEYQGKKIIGKTILIVPGAVVEGKAAIIDLFDDKKKSVEVKFIK